MSSSGSAARVPARPAAWTALLVAGWSLPVLGLFLWRFPVPVEVPQALQVLRSLLTASVMLATATLAGRLLLRLTRLDRVLVDPAERLLHAAALGYGAAGMVAFGAALVGGLRLLPWIAMAGLLWLLARRDVVALDQDLQALRCRRPMDPDAVRRCLQVALGVAMSLMLLEALAPPTAYDALRYHLRLPRMYAAAGEWIDVAYDFNSAFPQNVDMLFALAFILGAPAAASLTHLLLGWLATGAVALLAVRTAGARAGLPAAALFYTMPVVAINSAWAYVDLGLALFTLLTVRALWGWWESGDVRWIWLGGILAGLGLATKYTGAATLLVGLAVIVGRALGPRRLSPRKVLSAAVLFVVLGLAVAAPWLGHNAAVRGNPVYPFASNVFGLPPGDTYRAERHQAVLERPEVAADSLPDVLLIPWRFTMAPWVRDEMVGPALLIGLLLLALAPARGAGWLLALAAAYGVVWLGLSPQMRLFTHGLGLLAAAATAGWLGVRRRGGAAAVVASAAMVIAVAASLLNLAVIQRGLSDPFPVVTGMESRDHYLRRMVDGHRAIEFINQNLPADARVLFVGEIFGYYCERDHVLGSKFDRAPIVDWIASSADLSAFLGRLRRERITHVLYSQVQMKKFAVLPGRYLDWPDRRSREIYREFMTRWLEFLYEDPDAIVARVLDHPRSGDGAAP